MVRQFGLGFSEVVFSVGSPGTSSCPQEPGPGFGKIFVLVGLFHLETLLVNHSSQFPCLRLRALRLFR